MCYYLICKKYSEKCQIEEFKSWNLKWKKAMSHILPPANAQNVCSLIRYPNNQSLKLEFLFIDEIN